jgi:hypothetical protein
MQNPPWQGPIPSLSVRRMSSRFVVCRLTIASSNRSRVISSHSQMISSDCGTGSLARTREPSQ